MNSGDNACVLVFAVVVLFMTPGLALFYGGVIRTNSAVAAFGRQARAPHPASGPQTASTVISRKVL